MPTPHTCAVHVCAHGCCCPDPRWSLESAGPSPRPQCTIMRCWRLGRAPQPGHRAGSSWGTLSLAAGHPLPALQWDTAPHQGPTSHWQRGEQGGCGVLGSEGVMAQPSCQPDGPPRGTDLVKVAMEAP